MHVNLCMDSDWAQNVRLRGCQEDPHRLWAPAHPSVIKAVVVSVALGRSLPWDLALNPLRRY